MTKMKFDNQEKLLRVKEKEWREALDELTAYITWRLHRRTEFGAHSEAVLGDTALAHYSHEAYTKLICGEWNWDENLSLAEQLKVIAGSLICNQVTKWKRNPEAPPGLVDPERMADVLGDERDEQLDVTYEIAFEVIKGDKELEDYL